MVEANCSKDIWTQRSCPTLPVWCDYHPSYQSRSLLPSLESTVVPGPKKCSSCRWVGAEWFTDSSLRKPCCSQSRHLRALFLSTDDMTLCRISHWIDNNKTPKLYLLELKKKVWYLYKNKRKRSCFHWEVCRTRQRSEQEEDRIPVRDAPRGWTFKQEWEGSICVKVKTFWLHYVYVCCYSGLSWGLQVNRSSYVWEKLHVFWITRLPLYRWGHRSIEVSLFITKSPEF